MCVKKKSQNMPCKWRQWHGELNARLFACICECIYRKNFALSFVTVSCFLHRAPSVCSRDECARINSITVVAWKFIAPNRSYVLTTWCFFFGSCSIYETCVSLVHWNDCGHMTIRFKHLSLWHFKFIPSIYAKIARTCFTQYDRQVI